MTQMTHTLMMDQLFERLYLKRIEGLPYDEAIQFLLWVYCTLDVLPREFSGGILSRQDLCGLLSKLGATGKIIVKSPATTEGRQLFHDVAQPEHWDNIVAKFLRKEVSLDYAFPTRISHYV